MTVGSGVLGVKVICLEASKWLSHCVSPSIEARKQDPTRTYRNDNVIRQMYNVIHFDLFTIDSEREKIFCIIPKFHVRSMTSKLTQKVGCTIVKSCCLIQGPTRAQNFGICSEKISGITTPTNCSSFGYPHSCTANTASTESPSNFFGAT